MYTGTTSERLGKLIEFLETQANALEQTENETSSSKHHFSNHVAHKKIEFPTQGLSYHHSSAQQIQNKPRYPEPELGQDGIVLNSRVDALQDYYQNSSNGDGRNQEETGRTGVYCCSCQKDRFENRIEAFRTYPYPGYDEGASSKKKLHPAMAVQEHMNFALPSNPDKRNIESKEVESINTALSSLHDALTNFNILESRLQKLEGDFSNS